MVRFLPYILCPYFLPLSETNSSLPFFPPPPSSLTPPNFPPLFPSSRSNHCSLPCLPLPPSSLIPANFSPLFLSSRSNHCSLSYLPYHLSPLQYLPSLSNNPSPTSPPTLPSSPPFSRLLLPPSSIIPSSFPTSPLPSPSPSAFLVRYRVAIQPTQWFILTRF